MDRREFLVRIGGLVLAAPLALEVAGCGDDSNDGGGGNGDANGFTVTSSETSGHTHNVTVLNADLANPPVEVTYTSTSSGGHTHAITLSQAQLTEINGGGTVTVTSTENSGHTHSWTIRRP
jgi:hypothetical protein